MAKHRKFLLPQYLEEKELKRGFKVDCHDISKFLSLCHPDKHYIYNKNAFKQLLWLINADIPQDDTDIDSYILYRQICFHIGCLMKSDKEFMAIYRKSDAFKLCPDESGNIMVQDFVYALYSDSRMKRITELRARRRELMKITRYVPSGKVRAVQCNHSQDCSGFRDDKSHKKGFDGERWVFEYEKEKLIGTKYAKKVVHVSKDEPFAGYDIRSYTREGEKMLIEVKTSERNLDTMLGITQHELEMSKKWGNRYYLYRLYDYKDSGKDVKLMIIRGDLSRLCENPIKYWVRLVDE